MNKKKNELPQKECYKLKIIIIGDQSVGKTNIINRYVKGEFSHDYMITIGMDFLTCNLELDDKISHIKSLIIKGKMKFSTF